MNRQEATELLEGFHKGGTIEQKIATVKENGAGYDIPPLACIVGGPAMIVAPDIEIPEGSSSFHVICDQLRPPAEMLRASGYAVDVVMVSIEAYMKVFPLDAIETVADLRRGDLTREFNEDPATTIVETCCTYLATKLDDQLTIMFRQNPYHWGDGGLLVWGEPQDGESPADRTTAAGDALLDFFEEYGS